MSKECPAHDIQKIFEDVGKIVSAMMPKYKHFEVLHRQTLEAQKNILQGFMDIVNLEIASLEKPRNPQGEHGQAKSGPPPKGKAKGQIEISS